MAPRNLTRLKQLPLELIDYTIVSLDHYKDDKWKFRQSTLPTLKACSLACKTLNDICRPRIFRDFTLDLRMAPDKIEILPRLSFLHFNAPHLFKYITNLTIVWGDDVQDTPTWILDALHRFVNLRSLTITNLTRDGSSPPAPFTSAVMNLTANAPLRKLVLRCWNFSENASNLLHILALCSSTLEELSLHMCYIRTPETFPKPVDSELPPVVRLGALRRIRLSQGDIPASQLNGLEIPNLDFLSCAYVTYPLADIPWIPVSLSTVALNVMQDSDLPRLSRFIRPSCLTMTVHQRPGESSCLSAMTWISRCLACLPFLNELRQLNLDIEGTESLDETRYSTLTGYQELYRALQPLHQDGSLERVKLTHQHTSLTGTDMSEEAAILDEVFGPLLHTRPVIFDITLAQWDEARCMFVDVLQHRPQCLYNAAK